MTPDDVSFKMRPDHTIELSNGRIVEPTGALRNIHKPPDKMPIVAVERIGRRLSVTTERRIRGVPVWFSEAFPILPEDDGRWPGMTTTTFPGTIATIAGDDHRLFRLPGGGIATLPADVGFDVLQVDERRFVAYCAPRAHSDSPKGDNVWGYDRSGGLLWRIGHNPSLPDGAEYRYDYGIAIVRGVLWALCDKAPAARINLDNGAIVGVGSPPREC